MFLFRYVVLLLLQLLIYALAGINLGSFLLKRRIELYESLILGIAIMYTFQLLLSFFNNIHSLIITALFFTINIIMIVIKMRKKPFVVYCLFRSSKHEIWAFAVLCAVMLYYAVAFYITPLHGFDGLMIYGARARIIFRSSITTLFDTGILTAHNKYPLMLSLNEYFSCLLNMHFDYNITSIPFIIYIIAFSSTVLHYFRKKLYMGMFLIAIFFLTPLFMMSDAGLVYQYADFLLSIFFFSASVSIHENDLSKGLYLSSMLPFIKNEGWVLLCAILIHILVANRKNILKTLSHYKSLLVLIVLNLSVWLFLRHMLNSYIEEISLSGLLSNIYSLKHIFTVTWSFLISSLNPRIWGFSLIIPLIIIVLKKQYRIRNYQFLFYTIIPMSAYIIVSSLIPGDFFIDIGDISYRLISHIYPIIFFFGMRTIIPPYNK